MFKLHAACLERADEVYAIANERYNREFKRIPIVFSNKLTKTGGYFQFKRLTGEAIKIQLSNSILQLNPTEFVNEVVGHEIAHHIACELYGPNEGHGNRWKTIMRLFGQDPKRCHSLKTIQSNKFTYKIGFETISVGKIRHNKIQSGYTGYSVRGCGQLLASHWVDSNKPMVVAKPRHTMPHTIKPRAKGSKADIVRAQILIQKRAGYNLQQCIASGGHLLHTIAKAANMKEALCKTYIKNNWSKV